MSIKVMKQALEALENEKRPWEQPMRDAAIAALRQAIEQAEQAQPVAWISHSDSLLSWDKFYDHMEPLYTAPPQRQPLTDEEIADLWSAQIFHINDLKLAKDFVRDIEAAHGITGESA